MENYELEEKGLPPTCKTMVGESQSALVHKYLNLHQIVNNNLNIVFGWHTLFLNTTNVLTRN